ncbi:helix-turn-helix domain-containing protein [Erysipelothrix rhusiopathiae]|uniref:helix-turn-helix domain-containing protein n=1 Tax=Erysipelothrix rhusiopathiae TaxID=1648 RepID=UPI0023B0E9B2|nr:helix-turn-helix domain-containing protein [Erysipelothrix rhusiopathiae]MDE8256163.1 helix-turn-helix domain-containing protein [Erysipelothrix rhusiopathiae]
MGKQTIRSYEDKLMIVQEILNGKSYRSVSEKYNVRTGTIANWKRKLMERTLHLDRCRKKPGEVEDIEIIKKSYTLLMKSEKYNTNRKISDH